MSASTTFTNICIVSTDFELDSDLRYVDLESDWDSV